jgi:hypothetical protein
MRFKDKIEGQSLIEILIGLGLGALIITTASIVVVFILKAGPTNRMLGVATNLTSDILNKAKVYALADWNSFSNLANSSSSPYFFISSSSGFLGISGKEGILSDDIRIGLVGQWGFDEATGTTVYDQSGNGNHGILSKNSLAPDIPQRTSSESCKIGSCLLFNGGATSTGNYVFVPYSPIIDINGPAITLSAWVYILGYPTSGYAGIIRHNGYNYGYRLLINPSGKVYFQLTGINGHLLVSNGSLPLNKWVFVAGVLDNGIMKIYIDGAQDPNIRARPGNIDPGSEGIYIGQTGEYSSLNGYLDDVRIYNRNLSQDEIKRLYESKIFSRFFYKNGVCRSILPLYQSSSISGNPPCGGGYFEDPSTFEIVAVTEWVMGGEKNSFSLSSFVTRWTNFVFDQTDWSGGANPGGVYSLPSNQYASSSNITTTPYGSLQIKDLTQF